jgi:hypothetical protein
MYAAVGATFMTGGMGLKRRYFSASVVEAAIYDGTGTIVICGAKLCGYAGTYCWSDIVSALGGPQNSPLGLARRFEQLSATIAAADRMFSWRAPQP